MIRFLVLIYSVSLVLAAPDVLKNWETWKRVGNFVSVKYEHEVFGKQNCDSVKLSAGAWQGI